MKVIVTENPGDVNNLMALGEIKTRYEGETGNMNNEELMRHAAINLRKKAASMNAHCVLVETKFFRKPYGELPVVDVTAKALRIQISHAVVQFCSYAVQNADLTPISHLSLCSGSNHRKKHC